MCKEGILIADDPCSRQQEHLLPVQDLDVEPPPHESKKVNSLGFALLAELVGNGYHDPRR